MQEWWEDYDPAIDDKSRDPEPDSGEDADEFDDLLREYVPDDVDDDPTGLAVPPSATLSHR